MILVSRGGRGDPRGERDEGSRGPGDSHMKRLAILVASRRVYIINSGNTQRVHDKTSLFLAAKVF